MHEDKNWVANRGLTMTSKNLMYMFITFSWPNFSYFSSAIYCKDLQKYTENNEKLLFYDPATK